MSTESARKQGQSDGSQGKGPANTNGMTHQEKQAYNTAYQQGKK